MNFMSLKLKYMGIVKILFISYILIIFPLYITQTLWNNKIINTYKQELITSNNKYVNEFTLNMENNLKELIGITLTVYSYTDFVDILNKSINRDTFEKVQDSIKISNYINMLINRNFISGVYIYKSDGEYFFTNSNNTGVFNVNENLTNSPWLESIKPVNKEFSFLATHRPNQLINGSPVFSIVRNIIDSNSGKSLGLILIDLNPDMIGNISFESTKKSERSFIVVDSDSNIIFHTNKNQTMTQIDKATFEPVFTNNIGNFKYDENGIQYLASYNTSEVSGWKVIAVTPLESVVKNASSIRNTLLWIAILSILFAIICSVVFSIFISNPIKNLTKIMKNVENGNLNTQYTLKGAKEVYILGKGFNSMIARIKYLLENEYQLKLLKKDAEFKTLQAQINPHFLYNTLESIAVLADIKKVPEVSKTCKILSSMFRYSIGMKNNSVSIRNEIEHLQDYISIIKLRFEDTIFFNIKADEGVYDYETLKLTLQPLVENSINHGLSDLGITGIIDINIFLHEACVIIEISDNGKGISPEKLKEILNTLHNLDTTNILDVWQDKGESIGLKNIHQRLSLHFGLPYGIESIECIPKKGTKIRLKIPAIKITGGFNCIN